MTNKNNWMKVRVFGGRAWVDAVGGDWYGENAGWVYQDFLNAEDNSAWGDESEVMQALKDTEDNAREFTVMVYGLLAFEDHIEWDQVDVGEWSPPPLGEWHEETTIDGDVYVVTPEGGYRGRYLLGNRNYTNGIRDDHVRLFVNAARLLAACEALVQYVDAVMDFGERACPLCGHHHIHTDATNIGTGDREYERRVCPYPIAQAAIAAAKPEE